MKYCIEKTINIKKLIFSSICVLFLMPTFAENRFDPPSVNASLEDFNKRLDSGSLNVDFIVAHSFNIARKIERDVGEFVERTNTALFNNVNQLRQDNILTNSALSNSVVIPPGTKADTIIVINISDGDSFAIQR